MIGAISADGRGLSLDLPRLEHDGPPLAQAALGERDHLDHALIGLARGVAEGEDAVLVQDQALDVGFCSNTSAAALARPKPGAI